MKHLPLIIFCYILTMVGCIGTQTVKDMECNLPYDLPNEAGTWVSVSDTTYTSMYYLIDGKICVSDLAYTSDLGHYGVSPRIFLSKMRWLSFISQVDINSFEVNINDDCQPYARDKKQVYYPTDAADVNFIDGEDWGCGIYSGNLSIKGADPHTFQYIGGGYAIDKEQMYYRGERIIWNEAIIPKPTE